MVVTTTLYVTHLLALTSEQQWQGIVVEPGQFHNSRQ